MLIYYYFLPFHLNIYKCLVKNKLFQLHTAYVGLEAKVFLQISKR